MLQEPLLNRMSALGLSGMLRAFEQTQASPTHMALGFEERLAHLLDAESSYRQSQRLAQRLRLAQLAQTAVVEDIDQRSVRGLDRNLWNQLLNLGWLEQHLNVLITGPTGIGKSYLACALGQLACRQEYSVRYLRLPRLSEDLIRAAALQKKSALFKTLAKVELIILDDIGISPLADAVKRDLLEILDDRYNRKSTIVTSQLPVDRWHAWIDEPTLADAILDRLIHNSYRLALTGESLRARRKEEVTGPTTA